MNQWKFFARHDDFSEDINVSFGVKRDDGGVDYVSTLVLTRVEQGKDVPGPTLEAGRSVNAAGGNRGFLQAALDCAWALGLRPTSGETFNDPTHMQRHLEDMRALAFHYSKAEKP